MNAIEAEDAIAAKSLQKPLLKLIMLPLKLRLLLPEI
jgi:hypothetical protein